MARQLCGENKLMGLILGHHLPLGLGLPGILEVGVKIRMPQANTLLPPTSTEAAGDRIFVLIMGTAAGPIVDGTWFQLNHPLGASFTVHTKVAAGNATDDAFISGIPGNTVSVGVKFTMKDIPGPGSWDFNAQGTSVNSIQPTFICGSLPAFLAPAPSISFFVGERTHAPGTNPASGPGSFSDPQFTTPPDGGVILADKTEFLLPNQFTKWHAANWHFQPIKATYASGKTWSGADPGTPLSTSTRGWRYDHD